MRSKTVRYALTLALAFLMFAGTASAQKYVMRRTRQPKDLPAGLQQSLQDKVSEDAGPYLDKEDEKKNSGQPYTDLQQKFEYLPTYGPGGSLSCSVKLGGAEYDPKSKASSKGAATGKLKYLVFSYAREGNKWVGMGKPKWESQDLGKAAGKEMTSHITGADKRKAATEAAQQKKKAALAAALQKKFGSNDTQGGGSSSAQK